MKGEARKDKIGSDYSQVDPGHTLLGQLCLNDCRSIWVYMFSLPTTELNCTLTKLVQQMPTHTALAQKVC